jgi:molybdate transport system substrate-binding protein
VRRTAAPLSALVALAALLTGCGGSSGPAGSSGASSPSAVKSASVTGTITVLAASSLQEAFTKLGAQFEAAHPGTKVVFSFGPSSGLAEQIGQGAPADVFASASTKNMDTVVSAGAAANPTNFVSNTMEIAVPPKNPAHIGRVADLARKGVKVAVCQAAVPCGATALKVFANAKIKVTPVTQEVDVKSTLSKVTLGEVDAGVVYVTDVRAAGGSVKGIAIPADVNASTTYPIAPLTGTKNKATASAFVAYVLSPDGLAALTAAGFSKP